MLQVHLSRGEQLLVFDIPNLAIGPARNIGDKLAKNANPDNAVIVLR